MSWECKVVKIEKVEKHPNADKLGIVEVEGTVCLVNLADTKEGDLRVLVPLESMVPLSNPVFKFLEKGNTGKEYARIKAVRLRGIFSDGILVPVPEVKWYQRKPKVGQNVADLLGAYKFEEGEEGAPDRSIKNKIRRFFTKWVYFVLRYFGLYKAERHAKGPMPVFKFSNGRQKSTYELEKFAKCKAALEGKEVVVTEKIHGTNVSCFWDAGTPYAASRNLVKGPGDESLYTQIAKKYGLFDKMSKYPGLVLYGEGIGVQDLKYGHTSQDPGFAAFDLYDIKTGEFLNYDDFAAICKELDIPTAPVLYRGPFDEAQIAPLVNSGNPKKPLMSVYDPKTLKEGVVVKPVQETRARFGRVALKWVSERYLTRSGGTEYH